ncbi:MAG: hypothetical protein V4597_11640 [Pseudomonadota bacterium]
MTEGRLNWDGDRVVEAVLDAGWNGLVRAVVTYHAELLRVLSVPNAGKRMTRKRDTVAGKKGSTYTIYPNPSRPGEPPRKRTGWLQAHVRFELDQPARRGTAGVDLAALYGVFLELGTRNMDPRPWLLATLTRMLPQLRALAEGSK